MSNLNDMLPPQNAQRVYAKKTAEHRLQERRERLLEAGLALFGTQGYANTTIESLCSEAKVTTRHFYQAFNSREALLLAVYNQLISQLQDGLLHAIQTQQVSFEEKFRLVIEALVAHYLTDNRRARVGVLEVVGASPAIEQRRREAIHSIVDFIKLFLDELVEQQQIPRRDYHWLAVAMVGGVNELMAEWLMNPTLGLEALSNEIIFIARSFTGSLNFVKP